MATQTQGQHTKGPWLAWLDGMDEFASPKVLTTEEEVREYIEDTDKGSYGNIRACVLPLSVAEAAPELLDMLTVAVNYFTKHNIDGQDLHVHEMRAALAKAEGRAA